MSTHDRPSKALIPRQDRSAARVPPERLLAWYRERDRDPDDLHRRYVRARYGMKGWSDADLARFHRYRRAVSRERAAMLVLARRYALRGLSAVALAALVAGLVYAAYQWWRRRAAPKALPAAPAKARPPEASGPKER